IEEIYRQVAERGPIAASALEGQKGSGGWWGWSHAKHAFEWLFWAGRITTAHRRGFERFYDLPERVLPQAILD
ncbi:MAG: winged helix-turn-helix domain-containing protein, partial [Mesorhizobium sp.]